MKNTNRKDNSDSEVNKETIEINDNTKVRATTIKWKLPSN
jgi:hypothetical protein